MVTLREYQFSLKENLQLLQQRKERTKELEQLLLQKDNEMESLMKKLVESRNLTWQLVQMNISQQETISELKRQLHQLEPVPQQPEHTVRVPRQFAMVKGHAPLQRNLKNSPIQEILFEVPEQVHEEEEVQEKEQKQKQSKQLRRWSILKKSLFTEHINISQSSPSSSSESIQDEKDNQRKEPKSKLKFLSTSSKNMLPCVGIKKHVSI